MKNLVFGLATTLVVLFGNEPARAQQASPQAPAPGPSPATRAADARGIKVLERRELPGDLIREKLRLPGFDPDEAVPAIAVYPAHGGPFPVAIVLHCFRGAKEDLEAWCRDLAKRGVFALSMDAHLHGERSVAGIFKADNIAALGGEYSIWVHQTSIARTAQDVPVVLDTLAQRVEVDATRVAATGFSMGGSTAMVLAWREPRVRVVVSIVGAVDFWWDVIKIAPGPEQDARKTAYGPRLRELVDSLDPKARFRLIPPKALLLVNGGRDEYIELQSVSRFVADLEPLYGKNGDHLRFVPFPEAGHGVTAAMWKEAQDWIVRGLDIHPLTAKMLALSYPDRQKLITDGVLHDGMAPEEAEAVLGPATGKTDRAYDWYWNPGHRRHVAPFLGAKFKDGKLSDWRSDNR
jgi:pimeloyl-ACP methyl ester carboxylesterase